MRRVMAIAVTILLNAVSAYGAVCRADCVKAFFHASTQAQTVQGGAHPECHSHPQPDGKPDSPGSSDCRREFCSSSFTVQDQLKSNLWKAIIPGGIALFTPTVFAMTVSAPAFGTNSDPSEHQTDPPSLSFTATTVITC